jgi:phosphoglycerate dehydrogenase-like enzyme
MRERTRFSAEVLSRLRSLKLLVSTGPGLGTSVQGLTLGVLGLGNVGERVATIAQAFGMRVIAWSENLTAARAAEHEVTAVSREQLFAEADVLSIHLVLSQRSRGTVGASELALMKPTSILVNTSRGPIVDEGALVDALRRHVISCAAIDVYDTEPLPADHPLRSLDNALLTPHIGYVSQQRGGRRRGHRRVHRRLTCAGHPLTH